MRNLLFVFESDFRKSLLTSIAAVLRTSDRLSLQVLLVNGIVFRMTRRTYTFSPRPLPALARAFVRVNNLIFEEGICRRFFSLDSPARGLVVSHLCWASRALAFHFLQDWTSRYHLLLSFFSGIVVAFGQRPFPLWPGID